MFGNTDLIYEMAQLRRRTRTNEESVVWEANKILKKDLFADKKILQNLEQYGRSFEVLDEEDLDPENVFTLAEIKRICVLYRLKFLESKFFRREIPYEASLKVDHLNDRLGKKIKEFKVLAPYENFMKGTSERESLLFLKTNYDNYYLLHSWGKNLKQHRKLKFLPLRSFETLVITCCFDHIDY